MAIFAKPEFRSRDFSALLGTVPVGGTVYRHWQAQSARALGGAARKIASCGADIYAFAADERHFEQWASAADRAALAQFTSAQARALLYWAAY